jgi:hypothetical protein
VLRVKSIGDFDLLDEDVCEVDDESEQDEPENDDA